MHFLERLFYFKEICTFEKSLKIPKEVFRICKSKKYNKGNNKITELRKHNDQKKKCKRTNSDLQNIHIKLKIE